MADYTVTLADLEELNLKIKHIANKSNGEDGFRARFNEIIKEYLSKIDVMFDPVYEKTVAIGNDKTGRSDSLFGKVVTEFKTPGEIKSQLDFDKHVEQTISYIEGEANEANDDYSRWAGIVIDGFKIGFVRFKDDEWIKTGPKKINENNLLLLLSYYRSCNKRPLAAKTIADEFGHYSNPAKTGTKALWNKLDNPTGKTKLLFQEWRRLFSQVSGYNSNKLSSVKKIAEDYSIELNEGNVEKWFFATHTYFSIIVKLIAVEVLSMKHDGRFESFLEHLSTLSFEELKLEIKNLEERGGLYREFQIINFLEGDFFSWYLDNWDNEMAETLMIIINKLREFEPSSGIVDPENIRDLLKKLYQEIVPKKLRHDLGEFYTPDWLAEFVLNRADYNGEIDNRVLDPNCGSGTFIVLALKRLKNEINELDLSASEKLELILKNIVGFDLNPLAVISARTNYILALGELIFEADSSFEIPIYLADSIYSPEPIVDKSNNEYYYEYNLKTDLKPINIKFPKVIADNGDIPEIMTIIEDCIYRDFDIDMFSKIVKEKLSYNEDEFQNYEDYIKNIFSQIKYLDEQDWNKIWARIIKNRFALTTIGEFDFIVGNPAWVQWSDLPENYRNDVQHICKEYDIFSNDSWVGGIESDISTILFYSSVDKWLKNEGICSCLITQSVFKSRSSQGFRDFILPDKTKIKVIEAYDMVKVKPFEGASNRTGMLVVRKDEETTYPIPYYVWTKNAPVTISMDSSLEEAMGYIDIKENVAIPISSENNGWLTTEEDNIEDIQEIKGISNYTGHKGTTSDLNNVFWIKITEKRNGNMVKIINNNFGRARSVQPYNGYIESDLVYPLVQGRDISQFNWDPSDYYIIVPQEEMHGYTPKEMQEKGFVQTLDYFNSYNYKELLKNRSSYKRYLSNAPYYSLWNVGEYTFSNYKVVWREVSSGFQAAVISFKNDKYLGEKLAIPDHKLMFMPTDTKEEAHYLCSILNAPVIKDYVDSIVIQTQVGTRILDEVGIPLYDGSKDNHIKLVNFSVNKHNESGISKDEEKELNRIVLNVLS